MMKKERYCNECNGELISPTGGFIVCKECGLAHDIILDDREPFKEIDEWDDSYDSTSHGDGVDYTTPHITTMLKAYIPERLKTSRIGQQIRKYSTVGRHVRKNKIIFLELKKICDKYIIISHLYSHCCHFYKKISGDLEFRGRGVKNELIAWLIIYIQCRMYNIPFALGFLKQIGFTKNDVKKIKNRFFFLKEKYKLPIYNAHINKTLWFILCHYVTEPRMRSLLQKHILKLIVTTYSHYNLYEKKKLVASMVYILLKKFKYVKISYKSMANLINISDRTLQKQVYKLINKQ